MLINLEYEEVDVLFQMKVDFKVGLCFCYKGVKIKYSIVRFLIYFVDVDDEDDEIFV